MVLPREKSARIHVRKLPIPIKTLAISWSAFQARQVYIDHMSDQ